jgi:hypothetical protein
MNTYYDVILEETGIKHVFLHEKDTKELNESLKQDFFIPYSNCGSIHDSLKLFDNFKMKKMGKFKKMIYYLLISVLIMSVYFNPSVLMFYAVVYIIYFIFYMFYTKNKHYIRLDVFVESEDQILKMIYLFNVHEEKLTFFNEINKKNDKMMEVKTNLSHIYKSSLFQKVFKK